MSGTIYTQIAANKRATVLIVTFFILFISALGYVLGKAYFGDNPIFYLWAVGFSIVSGFGGYYYSDKLVLAASGARELPVSESEYVHDLVENLCIGAGLPKPKVYVIDSPALNAFATGRDPKNSAICFTSGIIEKLDKLELEGVIAHELSHIGNYDIRLMAVVGVLVGSITLLFDMFFRMNMFRSSDRESKGGSIFLIIGLVMLIISPIVATLIKLAISRNREYLADASAALLTRYPTGLAKALEKISGDSNVLSTADTATAHLFIANPFKSSTFRSLFDTHPPVEERIKRLTAM